MNAELYLVPVGMMGPQMISVIEAFVPDLSLNRLDELKTLPVKEVIIYTDGGIEVKKEGWAEQIPLMIKEKDNL